MTEYSPIESLLTRISLRVRGSRFTMAILLVIILTGFDLITKDISRTYWQSSGGITILDPVCRFSFVRNYESTFRLGTLISDENKQILFSAGSVLVIGVMIWSALTFTLSRIGLVGASCIVAGLIGNTGDRLVLGYVVDFIQLSYGTFEVPTFNLADVYVYSGFALFLVDIMRQWRRLRRSPA